MFLCLCGAIASLLLWSRLHDRQLGVAALAGK
jgi:putative membrane protein